MKQVYRLAVAVVAVGAAGPALAQDTPETVDVSGDRVTIGVGAASVPDYEGADDNGIIPGAVVVGRLSGFDFWTRGTQLYVDVLRDPGGPGTKFELGPIVAGRFDRTGGIDDAQVEALGERDTAIELGGFVGISRTGVITSDYDTVSARVAYVRDVAGAHDSYVLTPQLTYSTPLSIRTLVSLGVSADYVGSDYNDYYFTVTPAGSVASGLPVFDASDDGFRRVNVSLFGLYSLSGDLRRGLGVGAGVLYGRLLGTAADSPVVRNPDQWSGAVGLTYTF